MDACWRKTTGRPTRPVWGVACAILLWLAGCSIGEWSNRSVCAPAAATGTGSTAASLPAVDVAHWVSLFDDPSRDAWQRPSALVDFLGLRPGQAVADLGTGTGYFLRHLADAVGPSGTVYAVDVEPALVRYVRDRAERDGLANVVPILASRNNPRLPPNAVDLVLLVNTYHHIHDRTAYFRRLRTCLRPASRLVIVDWKRDETPIGPPRDRRISEAAVIRELKQAGYRLLPSAFSLPYQYVLVFSAPVVP